MKLSRLNALHSGSVVAFPAEPGNPHANWQPQVRWVHPKKSVELALGLTDVQRRSQLYLVILQVFFPGIFSFGNLV